MHRFILRHLTPLALMIIAFAGISVPASAQYYVYHGVAAAADGSVDWSRNSWGVSGQPVPTLSFFHYDSDDDARAGLPGPPACIVKVLLPGVGANPAPNAVSTVGTAQMDTEDVAAYLPDTINGTPTVDLIMPFPWQILFDNNPPGHWSITKPTIVVTTNPPQSNNTASTIAGGAFQALANTADSGVTVINGAQANCHP